MAKKSHKDDVFARRAQREENRLRSWRRTLKNSPEIAKAAIKRAMEHMKKQGWSSYELAQFYAQMKNGSAVPSDFIGDDGSVTAMRRA